MDSLQGGYSDKLYDTALPLGDPYRFLMEDGDLADEQKALIACGNAERIYHLN